MIRVVAALVSVTLLSISAHGQGAILETLDNLTDMPEAESVRAANTLGSVDLSDKIPPPRSQGSTATCVSWAVTYGAGSNAARRRGHQGVTLSPAFTYNLIAKNSFCRTSTTISKMLNALRDNGAVPIEEFAFDEGWCGRIPTQAELKRAEAFGIKRWGKFDARDPAAIKAQLARGLPVIFAMQVGPSMISHRGSDVILASGEASIGHAMLAIGYDDSRQAFRIQNSFGAGWGDQGYAWLSYKLWERSVQVGYVIEE